VCRRRRQGGGEAQAVTCSPGLHPVFSMTGFILFLSGFLFRSHGGGGSGDLLILGTSQRCIQVTVLGRKRQRGSARSGGTVDGGARGGRVGLFQRRALGGTKGGMLKASERVCTTSNSSWFMTTHPWRLSSYTPHCWTGTITTGRGGGGA